MSEFPFVMMSSWVGEWEQQPTPAQSNMPIEELNLSVRSRKCLRRESEGAIRTVGELVKLSADALLGRRNFGYACLGEVRMKLGKIGFALKGEKPMPPIIAKASFATEKTT